ncbi:MAG TPA: hypothetical protein VIE12_10495 [Actinomycetota bacterium]|jgi:hypothetical protein
MRLTKLTVVLSLFALVLVGCGGGDSDDGGGGGGGATIDGGALDAATCAQVVAAMASAYSGSAAAMTGGSGDLQTSVDQLEAFAANAPEEIRDDMQTITSGYAAMMQAFADAGYDPTSGTPPTAEQAAALQAATASINTAEFTAASDRVSAWFQEQCGS